MQQLRIELENCYGIRKLKHDFDFSKRRAFVIYAANGAMKTSLAKTFGDFSRNEESKDRIFAARVSIRNILDEHGAAIGNDSVVVLQPYDEVLGHTEKTSTLLVNSALRKEYEKLFAEIDSSKELFLKSLKSQSGSKKDLEAEITNKPTADGTKEIKIMGKHQQVKALSLIHI